MTPAFRTKARIQYSSQDELDVAVIDYCRGRSRHDLHARTRSALNGFYSPFAMAAMAASEDKVRQQAMRSIRQLTSQILEIKEQFFPELLSLDIISNSPTSLSSLTYPGQDIQVAAPAHARCVHNPSAVSGLEQLRGHRIMGRLARARTEHDHG